ncbi:hypothetical protein OKW46_004456 [Paraburkholderia sp. WSM4179]|nr:hypothetical protein [Paraburkholderia sp. WSM4179]
MNHAVTEDPTWAHLDKNEKPSRDGEGFFAPDRAGDAPRTAHLQRLNVGRLFALRAGLDFKRNALIFLQRLEALAADLRKVCEQILATHVRRDEAKTLSIVEPFDDTSFHFPVSLCDLSKAGIALESIQPRFSCLYLINTETANQILALPLYGEQRMTVK